MITPLAPAVSCTPLKGVEILMMSAQTVDETISTVIVPGPGIKNHTITLRGSAALTGAAIIETAHDPAYTGTWNPLGGAALDLATLFAAAAGVYQATFSNITFGAIRVRITTVVAGGNLSASYLGN